MARCNTLNRSALFFASLFFVQILFAQNPTFEVLGTSVTYFDILHDGGGNIKTWFNPPAVTSESTRFPSYEQPLLNEENIQLHRVGEDGLVSEGDMTVTPLVNGDILLADIRFRAHANTSVASSNYAGINTSATVTYTIRNTSAESQILYWAIDLDLDYLHTTNFMISNWSVALTNPGWSGTLFSKIVERDATGEYSESHRGEAQYSYNSNQEITLKLAVKAYADLAGIGSGTCEVLIDALEKGVRVGFSDAPINELPNPGEEPAEPYETDAPLALQLNNLLGAPACGPFMFSVPPDFFAFTEFNWDTTGVRGNQSIGFALAENMANLDTTLGITAQTTNFELAQFNHVDQNFGQMQDFRTYINGVGEIRQDGELMLKLENMQMFLNVFYPEPFGIGDSTAGAGWADINLDESDSAWVAELDPNATGQIQINFVSFSPVGQISPGLDCADWFGYYDLTVELQPVDYQQYPTGAFVEASGEELHYLLDLSFDYNLRFMFSSAFHGGPNQTENELYVNRVSTHPGGALPEGVDSLLVEQYWMVGTTLDSFLVDVQFLLGDYRGDRDIAQISILYRPDRFSEWVAWDDTSHLGADTLQANGLTSEGQFTLGFRWVPSGIADQELVEPQFKLLGNYPNPFNPQTSIEFVLPENGHTRVRIFDATGREIATVFEGVLSAGNHAVTFDAHGLASGTYFYEVTFGTHKRVQRMTFLK